MNKKSFFLGVVTGVVLAFVGLFVIGLINRSFAGNDPVQYLEKPVSYENKTETSFKVLQVLGNAALAIEASPSPVSGRVIYYGGNTVLILGENYYSDQIITIKNPQRVGTYSYTTNAGIPKTVPVIDGEIN